jgi:PAS domain S-box-containing protein
MPGADVLADLAVGAVMILAAAFVATHFLRRQSAQADEIQRLQREIREADERYGAIIADAPIACVLWKAGFTITDWNRQAELTFGFLREKILGRDLLTTLIHPEERKRFADLTRPLFAGGTAAPGTLLTLDLGGATLTGSWHHALLRGRGDHDATIMSMCLDLTELGQLQEDRSLFQRLIETSDEPTLVLHRRDGGHVRYANAAACRHFGFSAEELQAMRPASLIGRGTPLRHWWMVAADAEQRHEAEHERADGRNVPVEIVAKRIECADESVVALRLNDISERRATEERLRKMEVAEAIKVQETRYRQIFENSSDVLFTLSKTDGWHFQEVNPEASKALGVRAQTLAGLPFARILSGGLGQEAASALAQHIPYWTQCAATGLTCEYDGDLSLRTFPHTSGKAVYHVKLIPLADDSGLSRIICVAHDITRRSAFERQLLTSEAHFRTLAENTPDNIARWDTKGRYLYINPTHGRTLGGATKELIGTCIADTHAKVKAGIAQVVATGQAIRTVCQTIAVDSVIQLHDVSLVPEFDAAGRVVSVLGIGRDMTDVYRMQDTIRELVNRREETVEEERRRIALDLHEDLGQLLSALRMGIATLLMQFGAAQPAVGERSRSMIELVDRTIQSMRHAVAALRPSVLNEGLVPALEWLAAQSIRHYELDVHLELAPEGVEIDDPATTILFRIAQEAMTNIARHADATTVGIVLRRQIDTWQLSIRDNGVGFDPSAKQGHSYGLLGMSTRAAAIQGELRVTSAPGAGTAIEVTIPTRPRSPASAGAATPTQHAQIH